MRFVVGIVFLTASSCADAPPTVARPTYDYGAFRNPFPSPKTEPVVPPPAAPEPEEPKPDPCVKLCEDFDASNRECGSLAASCMRLFQRTGSDDNDICRNKNKVCREADAARRALGKCKCE